MSSGDHKLAKSPPESREEGVDYSGGAAAAEARRVVRTVTATQEIQETVESGLGVIEQGLEEGKEKERLEKEIEKLEQVVKLPADKLRRLRKLTASWGSQEKRVDYSGGAAAAEIRRIVRTVKEVGLGYENRYLLFGYPNVLIIYNTNNRDNAAEEAETIYDAFESTRNFTTTLERNKTKEEILKLIEKATTDYSRGRLQSALIVVLLSHGSSGMIDDCEGKPIKLSTIESAMCDERLENRPKLLITQCCQNNASVGGAVSRFTSGDDSVAAAVSQGNSSEFDPARQPASEKYAPTSDDFCAIMSCVSGEKSRRGEFIPRLAKRIKEPKKGETILDSCTIISGQMKAEKLDQTPIIQSTLRRKFYSSTRNG